jgi:hypothetical protein
MIKRVYRLIPVSENNIPLSGLLNYIYFLGYRFIRGFVQIIDGIISLFLAPLGMDTELYANFLYWIEKRRRNTWNDRYHKP